MTIPALALEDAAAAGIVIPDDLEERDPVSGWRWKHLVRMVHNELGLTLAELRDLGAARMESNRREKAEREAADRRPTDRPTEPPCPPPSSPSASTA